VALRLGSELVNQGPDNQSTDYRQDDGVVRTHEREHRCATVEERSVEGLDQPTKSDRTQPAANAGQYCEEQQRRVRG